MSLVQELNTAAHERRRRLCESGHYSTELEIVPELVMQRLRIERANHVPRPTLAPAPENWKNNSPRREVVINAVCDLYGVTRKELISPSRKFRVVWPRFVAGYLMRSMLSMSYPEIGRRLGGKDHTSLMHARARIEAALETDRQLTDEITFLRDTIQRIWGQP